MLTESFLAATESVKPPTAHLSSNLKDVGIFVHEFQPQPILRQGFKKSSVAQNCLAHSNSHIFAAQAGKAVVNVYSREKGNQEATVPFPQKITSLAFADAAAILILGTQDGRVMLWEVATGRVTTSSASHVEAVTHLKLTPDGGHIISASADATIHVWSLQTLVAMQKRHDSFGNAERTDEPIATFTHHRSAVTALSVGHSQQRSTTFVVSASDDKICYLWSLHTTQILRTFLLVDEATCAVLDPVDRAVYLGSNGGGVQFIDLHAHQSRQDSSIFDNSSQVGATPIQLSTSSCWLAPPGIDVGATQSITISYDGTVLLTGHASGKVLQWEAAKHRMTSELSSLTGQPVTNIQMTLPTGLMENSTDPSIATPTLVKPRLDLNTYALDTSASSHVPAEYNLYTQVARPATIRSPQAEIERALTSSELPESLIEEAIQSLNKNKTGDSRIDSAHINGHNSTAADLVKTDQLRIELASLRSQIANNDKMNAERIKRHLARMKQRETIGLQKREAFFVAKKAGKNGDEAMKPFMQQEKDIDADSDEDALSSVQASKRSVDIEMKG